MPQVSGLRKGGRWENLYQSHGSVIKMQLDMVAWVGGVEFLLEEVKGWSSPRGGACTHVFDDIPDVGVLKT